MGSREWGVGSREWGVGSGEMHSRKKKCSLVIRGYGCYEFFRERSLLEGEQRLDTDTIVKYLHGNHCV